VTATVALQPVGPGNWRACAALAVAPEQERFVSPVARYLALCAYDGGPWHPLAIAAGGEVVGFVMHGIDPADGAFWIGGLVIGREHQRRGYGRAAVEALVERAAAAGAREAALSYAPENDAAQRLYAALGFGETGEREGDEVVARRRVA
jgi:diamine N-acetyltransferase